ncbi:ABC transporter permease subunit/CPBP intramembrane protease [Planctomyces sp. SH-PL62]|uniref:ABC transporter permease subunit/CPBP intramembrane protease n=1 Tax=Planctomyces sp. SH-PL62 TaxID=1636152 RepID=UPI00078E52A6|nr:ABC transporter permease subunit/CPBP intramembrane protease [Planctomyces sp. SH-PL62]AMV38479.1 ABC-2 family transporter protein [Planctomyces sp. SH-PL62]
MNWSNVLLIFRREGMDQLRDRRTLFMVVFFPILLYPLIGAGVLQFAAALQEKPRRVVIVGAEHLPAEPPLLDAEGTGFNPALFDSPAEAGRLEVERQPDDGPWGRPDRREQAVRGGEASAVMVIPADLPEQFRAKDDVAIPIHYKSVDETSQITYLRLREALDRWKTGIVEERRKQDHLPAGYAQPIEVRALDAATAQEVGGNVWGRIFPFLLVLMSLTGAFYPAVDLCAGEKERGTMETLLISPAGRAEIVMGKFLAVLVASVTTAVLNLVSMGLTGLQMAQRASGFGGADPARQAAAALAPPTLQSALWMIVLLIPLAAFFSAICLALAAMARSMKEGQYYMTPLYLICLPLIFLTMAPGIELNPFYSIVPVTGVALLLRALIVGDYATAFRYFPLVLIPTLVYAWLALRWAVEQFQDEEVLFRESERFNLVQWLRSLVRDRGPRPTSTQAVLAFALIISASWLFAQSTMAMGMETGLGAVAAGQSLILLVPMGMAFLLTTDPLGTLRLRRAHARYFGLAAAMAVAFNPVAAELSRLVQWTFPISDATRELLQSLMFGESGIAPTLLVLALLPAICEEAAFRGFILSGLQSGRRTRSAIVLSALLFGFLHVFLSLFQQLFNATLLGVFLGLLAIRSRSLWPGVLFHALNNGFAIGLGAWAGWLGRVGVVDLVYLNAEEGLYHRPWVAVGAVASAALFAYLWKVDRPDAGEA